MKYFLSLGSNEGHRRKNLARALRALEAAGVSVLRVSSLYKTEPVDGGGKRWFLNLVAEVGTSLEPESLLEQTQAIEKKLGRPSNRRQGPRPIDIDILLAGDRIIETERLTVPHSRLERRNFVLVPLTEIAGEVVHPLRQKKIRELCAACSDTAAVVKLPFSWPCLFWKKRFFPPWLRLRGGR